MNVGILFVLLLVLVPEYAAGNAAADTAEHGTLRSADCCSECGPATHSDDCAFFRVIELFPGRATGHRAHCEQ